jgi:hypothetical protein
LEEIEFHANDARGSNYDETGSNDLFSSLLHLQKVTEELERVNFWLIV